MVKDDPQDPERDVVSRLEEMKSRESILIIAKLLMGSLYLFIFSNPMLLLEASKG